ncbi:MAG: glycosyltransferase [Candidatus Acidiferrum sp.]
MLSIVIPTHNRPQTLQKAISAYCSQTALQEISEIVVIDDGSTDSTSTVVNRMAKESVTPIRYIRQENKGPAAARNLGIRVAESPLILFTDDDIIPQHDLVAEHVKFHNAHAGESTAVLGFVTWLPDLAPTPFMDWYGSEVLFAFSKINAQTEVDYRYFYTCNISLKKDFLLANGMFDEEFKVAAFEDIELGFRLSKAGMRLFYNPQAVAYHEQFISFEDACNRHQKSVAAAAIFGRRDAGRPCIDSLREPSSFTRHLKRLLAPVLSPVKPLVDCRIPLPWGLYRAMFRIYR